jgi:hypothetical protein
MVPPPGKGISNVCRGTIKKKAGKILSPRPGWKLVADSWKLATGSWQLGAGTRQLATGS